MKPTPTPRTDDLVPTQGEKQTTYQYILVLEEHARELERELADARAWSSKLADLADDIRADLAAEREQVAILRSDETRLSEFAKAYRLRADEADDKLAAERALADRLAKTLEGLDWVTGHPPQSLQAWKEVRSESH